MSTITLEAIEAKQADIVTRQSELDAMLARFKSEAVRGTTLEIAGIVIELAPGERYAGVVLNDDGSVKHHLVLLPARPDEELDWPDAMDWAKKVGGSLPTRQEASVLFANCKPVLEKAWHWTCEEQGSSYAWRCSFSHGGQYFTYRGSGGCAVAVRQVP